MEDEKMNTSVRTNHESRLKAFDLLQEFKRNDIPRKEVIDRIHAEFGMPVGVLYDWYRGSYIPYGRQGELNYTNS